MIYIWSEKEDKKSLQIYWFYSTNYYVQQKYEKILNIG